MTSTIKYVLLILLIVTSCKSANDYVDIANDYISTGDFQKALTFLNKAISIDNKNVDAYLDRGLVRANLSDYNGAIADYSEVTKLDTVNVLAYYNKAINYNRIKDQNQALANINRALEIIAKHRLHNSYLVDKQNAYTVEPLDILYERGIIYYEMDSIKNAISDFNVCINKGIVDAYLWRGISYLKIGNNVLGCEDLEISFNKGNLEAQKYIQIYCNKK